MRIKTFRELTLVVLMAMMPISETFAQDWKSVLSGISSALGEKVSEKVSEKTDKINISGTWIYTKPDCRFESEDLLSKAGGELASVKVEQKMTELMNKIGIDEKAVFTFNADSTYSIVMGTRTMSGTYSLNAATKEIKLTSRFNTTFTATVVKNVLNPDKVNFLFKADKIMSLAQNVAGAIAKKSTSKTISSVNTLLNKYDGLTLGFELIKEGSENKDKKENKLGGLFKK